MADRDQNWSFGGRGPDRRRAEDERRAHERDGPRERRSFDESRSDWTAPDPRGDARRRAFDAPDRPGYGGQEYGIEGGREHWRDAQHGHFGDDERETWRPGQGEPYGDLELNARNRGVQEFGPPHDYAYHPQAGHEFDADYLHWREEQMRGHDRDYHEWRRNQREAYDDDYRRFRHERRQHFGRSFQDWRNQRSMVGGIADTTVAPGVGGYGDKVGQPSGYDYGASSRPSGRIERPDEINASPAAVQTGGDPHHGQAPRGGTGGEGVPEFGREPSAVQRAADGARTDRDEEKK